MLTALLVPGPPLVTTLTPGRVSSVSASVVSGLSSRSRSVRTDTEVPVRPSSNGVLLA